MSGDIFEHVPFRAYGAVRPMRPIGLEVFDRAFITKGEVRAEGPPFRHAATIRCKRSGESRMVLVPRLVATPALQIMDLRVFTEEPSPSPDPVQIRGPLTATVSPENDDDDCIIEIYGSGPGPIIPKGFR